MCVCVCLCICVSACLCLCVNVLQAMGHSGEGINSQICLKFGTLKAWVNPWGYFFHFLKICVFRLYLGQDLPLILNKI